MLVTSNRDKQRAPLTKLIPVTRREWALFGLRWVLPLTLLLFLLLEQSTAESLSSSPLMIGSIVVATITNLLVAVLLLSERWSRLLAVFIITADIILALGSVAVTNAGLSWLGLIPIAVAACYFDWITGLVVGILTSAGMVVVQLAQTPQAPLNLYVFILTVTALPLSGPLLALLSNKETEIAALRSRLHEAGERVEQISKLATEYMRVVYEMADVLSASKLDPRRVLAAAIDFGLSSLERVGVHPPLFGAVLLFAKSDDGLGGTDLRVSYISKNIPPRENQIILPGIGGVIGQALTERWPAVCHDPENDSELRLFGTFRSCKSVLCLPLLSGVESYGVMLIGSYETDAFNETHKELMRAVANQTAASLQGARLYNSLLEERDRIVGIENSARAQLASDLHDGPTQGISTVAMRLNLARKLVEKKPQDALNELYQIEDIARRTAREIRTMLFVLRPKALEQGLGAGLEQLASRVKETYSQDVEVIIENNSDQLLDTQATYTLFSIVNEALNNVRKHAAATHTTIRLGTQQDMLVLEVADNGRGFDVQKALAEAPKRQGEGHLGLLNLQERAALIEGTLDIDSEPGKGTRLRVLIPLDILSLRKAAEQEQPNGGQELAPSTESEMGR
jgi:signal transduction histidine kinase